jgi:hypothetical protein
MDNLHIELAAHEASSNTFQYVAKCLGIVVLNNRENDECIAIWFFKIGGEKGNNLTLKHFVCKSHSISGAVMGVLGLIEKVTKWKNATIKFVDYESAVELAEDMFNK